MKIITCHTIALSILLCFFSGCKKNSDTPSPVNNNEMNATVLLSNGSTVIINARGTKAILGVSGPLGSPGYIEGTNETNNAVYINLFPAITRPGTFNYAQGYRCQYRVNTTSNNTPIYENWSNTAGSITITTVNDSYLEGSFTAVCRYPPSDSVVISGTFKGNIIGK